LVAAGPGAGVWVGGGGSGPPEQPGSSRMPKRIRLNGRIRSSLMGSPFLAERRLSTPPDG
jgi:hypothetical protein